MSYILNRIYNGWNIFVTYATPLSGLYAVYGIYDIKFSEERKKRYVRKDPESVKIIHQQVLSDNIPKDKLDDSPSTQDSSENENQNRESDDIKKEKEKTKEKEKSHERKDDSSNNNIQNVKSKDESKTVSVSMSPPSKLSSSDGKKINENPKKTNKYIGKMPLPGMEDIPSVVIPDILPSVPLPVIIAVPVIIPISTGAGKQKDKSDKNIGDSVNNETQIEKSKENIGDSFNKENLFGKSIESKTNSYNKQTQTGKSEDENKVERDPVLPTSNPSLSDVTDVTDTITKTKEKSSNLIHKKESKNKHMLKIVDLPFLLNASRTSYVSCCGRFKFIKSLLTDIPFDPTSTYVLQTVPFHNFYVIIKPTELEETHETGLVYLLNLRGLFVDAIAGLVNLPGSRELFLDSIAGVVNPPVLAGLLGLFVDAIAGLILNLPRYLASLRGLFADAIAGLIFNLPRNLAVLRGLFVGAITGLILNLPRYLATLRGLFADAVAVHLPGLAVLLRFFADAIAVHLPGLVGWLRFFADAIAGLVYLLGLLGLFVDAIAVFIRNLPRYLAVLLGLFVSAIAGLVYLLVLLVLFVGTTAGLVILLSLMESVANYIAVHHPGLANLLRFVAQAIAGAIAVFIRNLPRYLEGLRGLYEGAIDGLISNLPRYLAGLSGLFVGVIAGCCSQSTVDGLSNLYRTFYGTDQAVHVKQGDKVTLGINIPCLATASWTKNGEPIAPKKTMFEIKSVSSTDKGLYVCTFGQDEVRLQYNLIVDDMMLDDSSNRNLITFNRFVQMLDIFLL